MSQQNTDELWALMQNICNTVLEFSPEVVVALMNSAWIPLQGALKLWEMERFPAFPPLVRFNLGREKHRRYDKSERPYASGSFVGLYASELEIADYLWFLEGQSDWLEEMRQQMLIAYQGKSFPKRILVVDDWIAEGGTYLLSVGLLKILYPQSEICFVCGQSDWKTPLSNEWLRWYHPKLEFLREAPEVTGEAPLKLDYMDEKMAIFRLIAGYEGLSLDSLESKAISADSAILQPLLAHLPAEAWLKLPQYAEKKVLELAARNGRFYRPGPAKPHPQAVQKPIWYALRDVLRDGAVSVDQVRRRYRLETAVARRLLEQEVGRLLVRSGEGRKIQYHLAEDIEDYL